MCGEAARYSGTHAQWGTTGSLWAGRMRSGDQRVHYRRGAGRETSERMRNGAPRVLFRPVFSSFEGYWRDFWHWRMRTERAGPMEGGAGAFRVRRPSGAGPVSAQPFVRREEPVGERRCGRRGTEVGS